MQAKQAKFLYPGHGTPIVGAERVSQALDETARYLEFLVNETLRLMNLGHSLNEIIHQVKPPKELASRPYLRAHYDEPEFIIRNLWRFYGGWYDFHAPSLKPAPTTLLSQEIINLIGKIESVVVRAEALSQSGKDNDQRLASHLIDFAKDVVDEQKMSEIKKLVHLTRIIIYHRRMALETSFMAISIYRAAILDSYIALGLTAPTTETLVSKEVMEMFKESFPKIRSKM